MARNHRRLILWLLAGVAGFVLLALLVLAALWIFVDADDFRPSLETRASALLGRPVRLTGTLHWKPGARIVVSSDGGEIANAPGFGPAPFARWKKVELGLALRPLLRRQVVVDAIVLDGLDLQLARDAAGANNWSFPALTGQGGGETSGGVSFQVGEVTLNDAAVRYQDAASGADWRVEQLALHARLPEDLRASERVYRDLRLGALLRGGPLVAAGVRVAFEADTVELAVASASLPKFAARWADATLQGDDTRLQWSEALALQGKLRFDAPSLRALLATAGVTPPPMQDATTLGHVAFAATVNHAQGAAKLDALDLTLDDTRFTGSASLPSLSPLALRFELNADRVILDRYLEPEDVKSEPFTLPLAQLKSLDARGVLNIGEARSMGAVAKGVRIDVE
jgi:AsmA protein